MHLNAVWEALSEKEWRSVRELGYASSADQDTFIRVLNFLIRWNFVETRNSPEIQVRRKPNMCSPLEVVGLLRELVTKPPATAPSPHRRRLAERISCTRCSSRSLSYVGGNKVECSRCHERQWFAIDITGSLGENPPPEDSQPNWLQRVLIKLGFPQPAFCAHLPKPTKFFWFRCSECKKVSTDYPHGFRQYLTCQFCKDKNYFW